MSTKGISWSKNKRQKHKSYWDKRYPLDQIFVSNSTYARHSYKRRILEHNLIPYHCVICGIGPEWNGKPMVLLLDHINGISNDYRLENLRFICSNCDSQLPTYKKRNPRR